MGDQVEVNATSLATKLDNAGLTDEEKSFLANIMVAALQAPDEVEGFVLGDVATAARGYAGGAYSAGLGAAGGAATAARGYAGGAYSASLGAAGGAAALAGGGFGQLLGTFRGTSFGVAAGSGGTSAGVVV